MTVITRVYAPQGAARQLMLCRDSEVLLSGPAGTGKSRACLEKLLRVCLLNAGVRCLIVRKTLASLGSTALTTWREHVAREALQVGDVEWYGGSSQEPPQYRFTNGSVIVVGGMDKATKIMSSEYDLIYVQEATELVEDDWEALTTRLRNGRLSFQQIIGDCNPDRPTHWLNVRCSTGATTMLYARHTDNPVLWDGHTWTQAGAAYIGKLQRLTGVRKLRLYQGVWAAADGLIYEEWDPAVHLVDRFDVPWDWPRYWSVDFGYTNPFVLQMWAEDPDGRLFLYREIYRTRKTVDEHAALVASIVMDDPVKVAGEAWKGEWTEPQPAAIVCDHDAEGRVVLTRELGLGTVAAHKKVSEGIQAVQKRLRPAGDGRPRLFVMRDSVVERDPDLVEANKPTCSAEEIVGYIWDVKPGDKVAEVPRKEDDHGMDGLRYMVAFRDLRARPRIDWI